MIGDNYFTRLDGRRVCVGDILIDPNINRIGLILSIEQDVLKVYDYKVTLLETGDGINEIVWVPVNDDDEIFDNWIIVK